ncbi:MAG: hypothetical protein KF782_06135 [Labilithrix sp.]|nr:hypothetical protein [Labilithrix sp.]
MLRARSAGICLALMTLPSTALAQGTLTETLRVQAAFATEGLPPPQPRRDDVFVMATPELSYLWGKPDRAFSVTYGLTGALHSLGGASELAQRLTLAAAFDLTPRTRLLLSAFAAQSSLSNFLISQPASGTAVTLYPGLGTRLVTFGVAQGISHELTPRVRVEQTADANLVTTIAPSPPLDAMVVGVGAAIERVWPRDGLGLETRASYATTQAVPPEPDRQFSTIMLGPRWRRDWTPTVGSLVNAGATSIFSIDPSAPPLLMPSARASVFYTRDEATVDLSASTGVAPTFTAQLAQAHTVALRGTTILDRRRRISGSASIGYLNATLIDSANRANDQRFQAGLGDVEIAWQATALMQLFARYQVLAQVGEVVGGVNPSAIRDVFLVGVQISSRPPTVGAAAATQGVPTTFPRRVDQSDDPGLERDGGRIETLPANGEGAPGDGTRWIHTTPARPPEEVDDDE